MVYTQVFEDFVWSSRWSWILGNAWQNTIQSASGTNQIFV